MKWLLMIAGNKSIATIASDETITNDHNDHKWWYDCKRLQWSQAMIQLQTIAIIATIASNGMISDGCIICSASDGLFAACSMIDESLAAWSIVGVQSMVWVQSIVINRRGVINCYVTKCRMKNINPCGAFCWRIWSSHAEGTMIQHQCTLTLRVNLCWWFYRNTIITIFC